VLDPALFDCTAAAKPSRVTPVSVACINDPTCTTPLVVGHRGAGGQLGVIAPENSLAAVRAAIALGIEFIETDPRETSDGHLVNVHDPDLDRTTDGSGPVDMKTLAEIQALGLETSQFAGDFSCECVPTIEEVLLEAKGKVHVLLDANKTSRVDLLVEAVHATDTLEWAIFDTDDVAKIDAALALEPALLTMIRVSDEAELDTEIAHFAPQVPLIVEINGSGSPSALAPVISAKGLRPMTDVFGIDVVAALDDDPSLYAGTFAAGVVTVQTDRPDLVLRYLHR
jgi:glycerophosphoryl diester phosphodiesterase